MSFNQEQTRNKSNNAIFKVFNTKATTLNLFAALLKLNSIRYVRLCTHVYKTIEKKF